MQKSSNFIPSCKTYLWLTWFGPSTVIGVTGNKIDLAPVFTELHSQRARGKAGSCDCAPWREHQAQNGHRATLPGLGGPGLEAMIVKSGLGR